jgi:hypothetical protein
MEGPVKMEPWEERAIQETKSKNDLPENAVIRIYGSIKFLDGSLTTVNYKGDDDSEWQENYYYEANNDRQFFFVAQDLAEFVSRHPRLRRASRLEKTIEFAGIAGIIALVITLVISFLVIYDAIERNPVSVPEILANALTTILGFYFGKATNPQQQSA